MSEPEYNPDAIRKLNETMGLKERERAPCGVIEKNKHQVCITPKMP